MLKLAVLSLLNGISVAALYFIVASGFTVTFGLMRTINLAYGSLFLIGGYVGYQVGDLTRNWYLAMIAGSAIAGLSGAVLQWGVLDRLRGQDMRQALVTIGLSIVAADVLLAVFGGLTYQFTPPDWMQATVSLGVFGGYPAFRLLLIALSLFIGVVIWAGLTCTRVGLAIRAGVDDREMLSAIGVNPSRLFVIVATCGSALAGLAGVIGGTALSISPGEDSRYLLASLVVTIVGGMGSIAGAAVGALLVGLLEQVGLLYFPNYSIVAVYLVMVGVLALRPQGLVRGTA
ncbi:branched-chain amino acid ABC transporter permease [Bradyrhizobium sp. CCBAU 11434]|uniref:branched-chain amino acid ABC transporter permease n=1 Tax=Bradyrhizobium sp. CCBAU 11434 TaxID=1630885 RepID=UPI0023066461|nr:branched-chain amino acid ABC transporter permease [Bradyrhizobium sp. CCBAU 11434]